MEMELPGAGSLASFYAVDESEAEFTDELKHILEVLTQYYDTHVTSGGQQALVSGEAFGDFQRRLLESLDSFNDGPPFTLQRLCELLLNPRLTYQSIDKVSLAFEKLLLVTSTIPPCNDPYPSSNGQQGWNQTQEMRSAINATGENGATESRSVVDEEMPDVAMTEDKQSDGDKLPSEEASRSLENRLTASEENLTSQPVIEKEHEFNDSPLIDDELVDISLDDQNPVTDA